MYRRFVGICARRVLQMVDVIQRREYYAPRNILPWYV